MSVRLAEALRDFGFSIDHNSIVEGLKSVRHFGRLEFVAGKPDVLLDGAHNPAGAKALREYLDEFACGPVNSGLWSDGR